MPGRHPVLVYPYGKRPITGDSWHVIVRKGAGSFLLPQQVGSSCENTAHRPWPKMSPPRNILLLREMRVEGAVVS
jgi:hypothetical protein